MQTITNSQKLFFSTIRISFVKSDGSSGSGTGFFFQYNHQETCYPSIVSNKHVEENVQIGGLTFLKRQGDEPLLGEALHLDFPAANWSKMWTGHSNPQVDIAICPLLPILEEMRDKLDVDLHVCAVGNNDVPDEQQLNDFDAIEPITFIGYPDGIWDEKNLIPIARKGYSTSPISVDYEGLPRFIVDASVFPGSSGSPVFISEHGPYPGKGGVLNLGDRFFFLGIISEGYFREESNEIVTAPIPISRTPLVLQHEMIDLGVVLKARTVIETIEEFLKAPKFDTGGLIDFRHISTRRH